MSDNDGKKRRGIERTASALRREVQKGGGSLSQTAAEQRVRGAVKRAETKENRGR